MNPRLGKQHCFVSKERSQDPAKYRDMGGLSAVAGRGRIGREIRRPPEITLPFQGSRELDPRASPVRSGSKTPGRFGRTVCLSRSGSPDLLQAESVWIQPLRSSPKTDANG